MNNSSIICPRCGSQKMILWKDLTEEEQMLARRLPGSADFTPAEREAHRFCTRCWFEEVRAREERA